MTQKLFIYGMKCGCIAPTYFVATDSNLSESKNESRRLGTHKYLTNKQGKRLSSILSANGAAVQYILPC